MKKVLMIGRFHETGIELLRARNDVAPEIVSGADEDELMHALPDSHGVVVRSTPVDQAFIDAARCLEVVARHGVGFDAVDVDALTRRGIPLTTTPGSNATSVAEHTMFLVLALAKQCLRNNHETRHGGFLTARTAMRAVDIENKTMLLIGFGHIGSRVAPLARAFGMRVLVCDPYIDQAVISAAGCTPVADFHDVLTQTDVISVHCPRTAETRDMVAAAELGALKPGAFVINTARGGIIDESALRQALESGALGGAGLDVFESEPESPPQDHPLFELDNVIVSPHCAGVSLEASLRTVERAARNVLDHFDGTLDPKNVVNPEVL